MFSQAPQNFKYKMVKIMENIRQSNLRHLFDCSIKYRLSLTEELEQTKAMKMGLLFESIVLGEKKEGDIDEISSQLTKATCDAVKKYADQVKAFFKDGEVYKKINFKTNERQLSGEIDYFGEFEYQGNTYSGIVDLKLTGSIQKVWGLGNENEDYRLKPWEGKTKKQDFLQSFMYPYILMRNSGVINNFYYFVVESGTIENMKSNKPLIKVYDCTPTPDDFEWLESKIESALSIKSIQSLSPNKQHCLECQFFKSRSCEIGVSEFSKMEKINLSDLGEYYHEVK